MPFTTLDGTQLPIPVIAQIGKKDFEVCVPFKYRHPGTNREWTVPASEAYRRTDLASVPGFLLWLVPRYGAHTLAALLHDQLVDKDAQPPGGRVEADTIFRDALGELKVPWIRRWLMWAAVSVGTTWHSGLIGKLRVVAWALAVVPAVAWFWQHFVAARTAIAPWPDVLVFGDGMSRDLVVVAVASFAFIPRIGLGLLAGAALVFLFIPAIAVLAALVVYGLLDGLARGLLWVYNLAAPFLPFKQVANVPVVMRLNPQPPAREPGCPELVVEAEPAG